MNIRKLLKELSWRLQTRFRPVTVVRKKDATGTWVVCLNDQPFPVLWQITYSSVHLQNFFPSGFFFESFDRDLRALRRFLRRHRPRRVLLMGASKCGQAALTYGAILSNEYPEIDFRVWAMSPLDEVQLGKPCLSTDGDPLTPRWDLVRPTKRVRHCVERLGSLYEVMKRPHRLRRILLSYTKAEGFEHDARVCGRLAALTPHTSLDHLPPQRILEDCSIPNVKDFQILHNTLRYYWKANQSAFYSRLHELLADVSGDGFGAPR